MIKRTIKRTFKRTNHAVAILLTAILGLLAAPASADKPETPPPGMARYVMVLWAPGIPGPDTEKIKKLEHPDVEKLGGHVVKKNENRHEILLPKAAAKQLRKHAAVVYLQRIWMGEPLDDWDDRYEPKKAGFEVGSDSDVDIDWVRAFDYDKSGNVKQFGNDHFTFDTAGRLIRAEVGDKVETYKYDDFGNLTEKAVGGANPVVMPVDGSSNRLTGPEYDAAGNITTRSGRQGYEYDPGNQLSRVYATQGYTRRMVYDAEDERIGMMVDGDSLSRWTMRGLEGQVLREFNGEMSGEGLWYWELDEIYADGKLVAGDKQPFQYFENGAIYGGMRHYHLDHLGSVRVVTDSLGRSISEHEYYPYGVTKTKTYQEQINWGDPHLDSMRFAGHWRDFLGLLNVENTEYLDYMHARYYDPNLGRFLSADPLVDVTNATSLPQKWNRYAYAGNNPVLNVDPDGKQAAPSIPSAGAGPFGPAFGAALSHAHQMNTNPSYRRAAVDMVQKNILIMKVTAHLAWEMLKPKFIWNIHQSSRPYPGNDPTVSPGEGWTWHGPADKGQWHNPATGESLRPDLHNPEHAPHWDYVDSKGTGWRIYQDGTMELKSKQRHKEGKEQKKKKKDGEEEEQPEGGGSEGGGGSSGGSSGGSGGGGGGGL